MKKLKALIAAIFIFVLVMSCGHGNIGNTVRPAHPASDASNAYSAVSEPGQGTLSGSGLSEGSAGASCEDTAESGNSGKSTNESINENGGASENTDAGNQSTDVNVNTDAKTDTDTDADTDANADTGADTDTGANAGGNENTPAVPGTKLRIEYIDVGQGDSTLLTCGSESMLIDTGKVSAKDNVESALYENGVSELKYLVLTHPDADHIGFADDIIADFAVDSVIMPDKDNDTTTYKIDMQAISSYSVPVIHPSAGEHYSLGGADIEVFGPINIPSGDDTNNASLMMRISYGNNAFLFIGDAEMEEEEEAYSWACSSGMDLRCDVFKCGHHGGSNSVYDPLYDSVSAKYYIVSAGASNKYGHPSDATLNYIAQLGGEVYLTETRNGIEGRGNITVESDGNALEWSFGK